MIIKPPLRPLLDNENDLSIRLMKLRQNAANRQSDLIYINTTIENFEKELRDVQAVIASYFKQKE